MNPYGVDLSDVNIAGPVISLKVLYEGMPQTSGCEKCAEINGDNIHWCCKTQSPSMYYVEFLYVFQEVRKWNKQKRQNLILRAVRNYLDNNPNKGCIFYDDGCQVYEWRPFVCRMYGVIPEKNWSRRWESLKERQKENFSASEQCDLVTPSRIISDNDEDKWHAHTKLCERRLGVPESNIELHDGSGGSYRTFHDHLLLELFGEDILAVLTNVRMKNPSQEDIDLTIEEMRKLTNEETVPN